MRLAVLGFFNDLSYLVALPLGAFLFNSGSYVRVFATDVSLQILGFVLVIARLWNFQEKMNDSDHTFKGGYPVSGRLLRTQEESYFRFDITKACDECSDGYI